MVYRRGSASRTPSTSLAPGLQPLNNAASASGNIKVVVRVRPENAHEAESGKGTVVKVLDEHVLIFDPKEESSPDFYRGKKRVGRDLNKRKKRDMRFAFDRIFHQESSNEDMYNQTTKLILDGLLDGFNCSVFAYGATGAGKTFTMLGSYLNPGIVFLTMMDLYKRIESVKEDKTIEVAVSYLEVYNEQIRDLLVPGSFLPIREDPKKGVIISGLSLHKPINAKELLRMLDFGNRNRTQHPTDANAESSRSHAVFQVFVKQRDRTANISTDVRVAKMSLIDLAGSERATVTTNRGARFREGANINKSLLALGNCINALADGKSKGYVPYRNSKLTRLLKDSLGGNCRTVMIAAVSPSTLSFEDTYNTLNYANRAKNIKADLKRNVLSVDFHISQYTKIVDELRVEVTELRTKLKAYEDGEMAPAAKSTDVVQVNKAETDRLKGELVVVFEDRRSIRKDILELEGSHRDLALKIHNKSRCFNRVQMLFAATPLCEKVSERIGKTIECTKRRQAKIVARKHKVESRMDDNEDRLQRVHSEITALGPTSVSSELLESQLRNHHLEIELLDTKRHVKHVKKLCRYQETQAKSTEKIVTSLLQAYRKVYYILKGHGIATMDVTAEFEAIQQLVEGEREVAWADQTIGTPNEESRLGNSPRDDDHFDINQILTIPVLSKVNLLTHTPRRTPTGTPRSMRKKAAAISPMSCMKNSNNSIKPCNMTKLLSNDAQTRRNIPQPEPLQSPSLGTIQDIPRPCTPPGFKVSCPPKIQSPIARKALQLPRESPVASPQNDPMPSSYVSSDPVASVQLPSSSRLSKNVSATSYRDCPSTAGGSHALALPKAVSKCDMNSTFTQDPLNGVEPLEVVSADVTVALSKPTVDAPFVLVVPSSVVNIPVDISPPVPPRVPIGNQGLCQSWPDAKTSATPNLRPWCTTNWTVTKSSKENVMLKSSGGGGTVTKAPPKVNSGTVTKSKSSSSDEENTPPNTAQHARVVRAMDFAVDKLPSPPGKLTFAEALKSPGRALVRAFAHPARSAQGPRATLASQENALTVSKHGNSKESESGIPMKQRRIAFGSSEVIKDTRPDRSRPTLRSYDSKHLTVSTNPMRSRSALGRTTNSLQASLHRMGLPSTADSRSRLGSANYGLKPSYLQLTRSSSVKRVEHRRSLSMGDTDKDRTPDKSRGHSASRPLYKSKSKSSSQLPKRGTVQ